MSATTSYTKTIIVGVQYHATSCLFALTSPQEPGLLLAGKDPSKLLSDVPAVLKALYRVGYNMDVEVTVQSPPIELADDSEFVHVPSPVLAKVQQLAA